MQRVGIEPTISPVERWTLTMKIASCTSQCLCLQDTFPRRSTTEPSPQLMIISKSCRILKVDATPDKLERKGLGVAAVLDTSSLKISSSLLNPMPWVSAARYRSTITLSTMQRSSTSHIPTRAQQKKPSTSKNFNPRPPEPISLASQNEMQILTSSRAKRTKPDHLARGKNPQSHNRDQPKLRVRTHNLWILFTLEAFVLCCFFHRVVCDR